jgi:hypothetical protein
VDGGRALWEMPDKRVTCHGGDAQTKKVAGFCGSRV